PPPPPWPPPPPPPPLPPPLPPLANAGGRPGETMGRGESATVVERQRTPRNLESRMIILPH
ncbi:hypothetical protein B5K05_15460, partial [Rhizobium phaseoli]